MDFSTSSLRVLRAVAERGSFSAAATQLGYTQSGISRQVAALERHAGAALFERRHSGVQLTTAGSALLRHSRVILDELDAAQRAITEGAAKPIVRLGSIMIAGATLLPRVLMGVRARGDLRVTTREGTTPTLLRALRAGSIDIAVITTRPPHRPPDGEAPALVVETLAESALMIAAPTNGAFAGRTSVRLDELVDCDWIDSPATGSEPLLGVWPSLPGRPRVAHQAKDWLTKLHLVAAGCGVTTVPTSLATALPEGVMLLRVSDGAPEIRRAVMVRLPGPADAAVDVVADLLRAAATV